tara:strand:+ start:502 stop:1566 length:1065 start_codon:yes stop_codon:yes gene_type:complete
MIALAKRKIKIKKQKARLLLGFLLIYISCEKPIKENKISGMTMGTTYSVKIIDDKKMNLVTLKYSIDSILVNLNKEMSTWDPESEISRFNRWESTEPYKVSNSFFKVVEKGIDLSQKTNGLFDITVYDLLSMWGFGPNPKSGIPDKQRIQEVLSYTSFENITPAMGSLIKKNPRTKLDLNAIAKGYGVDVVFHFIKSRGFKNVFVEIGGEVRFSGYNRKRKNWSLGLENPPDSSLNNNEPFFCILQNNSSAVATSANYRNFVDLNGAILGHTVNPKSGFPVQTNVLSVTVIAETCMEADGWATALMTLGYIEGSNLLKHNKEVSAIWVLKEKSGSRLIASNKNHNILNPIYKIK